MPMARSASLLAHRQQRLDLLLGSCVRALDRQLPQNLVEQRLQLRFGARIGQIGDRLALKHRIDRRNRLDAELRGDELILVDVDLA